MNIQIFGVGQLLNSLNVDGLPKKWNAYRMDRRGIPKRLRALRLSMGYATATAFAKFLRIGYRRYNNWECGKPLPVYGAEHICRKCPGVTLAWIYDGDPDEAPFSLSRRTGGPPKGA